MGQSLVALNTSWGYFVVLTNPVVKSVVNWRGCWEDTVLKGVGPSVLLTSADLLGLSVLFELCVHITVVTKVGLGMPVVMLWKPFQGRSHTKCYTHAHTYTLMQTHAQYIAKVNNSSHN